MDQKKTENKSSDNPVAIVLEELRQELGYGSPNELFERAGLGTNTKTWYKRVNPNFSKATPTRKKDLNSLITGLMTVAKEDLNSAQIAKLHRAAGITNFSDDPASYKLPSTGLTLTPETGNSNTLTESSAITSLKQEETALTGPVKPDYIETDITSLPDTAHSMEPRNYENVQNNTVITQSGSHNVSVNIQNATVIYDAKLLQAATVIEEPKKVAVIDKELYQQTVRLAAEHYASDLRKDFILLLLIRVLLFSCLLAGVGFLVSFLGSDLNSSPTAVRLEVVERLKLSKVSLSTGEYIEATFTIINTGETSVLIQGINAGVRFGSEDWSGLNFDFPTSVNIRLAPGDTYTYMKLRNFTREGSYFAEPVIRLNGQWGGITNSNRVYFKVVASPDPETAT